MIKKLINLFFKGENSLISVLWYLMGTVLVQGVNFLMTPVYTNMMSVENYGMLSICTMWTTFFSTFITLQVHGSINNALVKYGQENIEKYTSSVQCIEIISFAVIFTVSIIFRNQLSAVLQIPVIVFIAILITSFFQACIQLMNSKLIAQGKHKEYFVLSFAFTVLSAGLSVICIYFQDSSTKYYGKIFGFMLAALLIGLVVFIYIFYTGRTLLKKEYCKFCLSLTLPLILHGLSQIVLGQSDRYMIKLLTDNADYNVGVYGYAHTLGSVINVLWLAFNYAWVPWYYTRYKDGEFERIKKIQREYSFIFTSLTMAFVMISPEIVKLMAPQEYWEGMNLVPVIAMGFYFMFLYSFPVNYEFYKEKTFWISTGTVLSALFNIGANYLLIPGYGALGASITTLLSYLLLFIFHFVISKFVIKNYEIKFWALIKDTVPMIIICVIYYFTTEIMWIRFIIIAAIVAVNVVKYYRYAKKMQITQ